MESPASIPHISLSAKSKGVPTLGDHFRFTNNRSYTVKKKNNFLRPKSKNCFLPSTPNYSFGSISGLQFTPPPPKKITIALLFLIIQIAVYWINDSTEILDDQVVGYIKLDPAI